LSLDNPRSMLRVTRMRITERVRCVQVFLLILFCPFNVVYRSSRFLSLRILRSIVLSPLYKVRRPQSLPLVVPLTVIA
jgi:hypothetical protein